MFLNIGFFVFGQNVASSHSSAVKVIKTINEYPKKQTIKNNEAKPKKNAYAYLTKIMSSYTKEEYDNRVTRRGYTTATVD